MMEERPMYAAWHEGKKMEREPELASAYIPFQTYGQLYEPLEGLIKGTIFPELCRPYEKKHKSGPMKYKSIYKMEGAQS